MRLTRELVDLLPAAIEDPGPIAIVSQLEQDNYHQRTANALLSHKNAQNGLWVFAFGSLIWKPRFEFDRHRRALLRGWQRSFCLGLDERYRGNPEAPGLMLSLDKGGSCEGIVYKIAEKDIHIRLIEMLETEPPLPPLWVDVDTDQGSIRCIALVSNADLPGYQGGLTEDHIADLLSKTVGMFGSMPDYLYNTIHSLAEVGIHDPYLWRMQELVAQRLEKRLA